MWNSNLCLHVPASCHADLPRHSHALGVAKPDLRKSADRSSPVLASLAVRCHWSRLLMGAKSSVSSGTFSVRRGARRYRRMRRRNAGSTTFFSSTNVLP